MILHTIQYFDSTDIQYQYNLIKYDLHCWKTTHQQ